MEEDDSIRSPLARWCFETGITYDALGEKIGMTKNHCWKVARGLNKPSADTIIKLSEVTGLTADEILEPWRNSSQEKPASDVEKED